MSDPSRMHPAAIIGNDHEIAITADPNTTPCRARSRSPAPAERRDRAHTTTSPSPTSRWTMVPGCAGRRALPAVGLAVRVKTWPVGRVSPRIGCRRRRPRRRREHREHNEQDRRGVQRETHAGGGDHRGDHRCRTTPRATSARRDHEHAHRGDHHNRRSARRERTLTKTIRTSVGTNPPGAQRPTHRSRSDCSFQGPSGQLARIDGGTSGHTASRGIRQIPRVPPICTASIVPSSHHRPTVVWLCAAAAPPGRPTAAPASSLVRRGSASSQRQHRSRRPVAPARAAHSSRRERSGPAGSVRLTRLTVICRSAHWAVIV